MNNDGFDSSKYNCIIKQGDLKLNSKEKISKSQILNFPLHKFIGENLNSNSKKRNLSVDIKE